MTFSPSTNRRSRLANDVGLKPFSKVQEQGVKSKRRSKRRKRKSNESEAAVTGPKSPRSTRNRRKNEEIREIFESKPKREAQALKINPVDEIFTKFAVLHDGESEERVPVEVNKYILDIRKIFMRELQEYDYSGCNSNASEIFLTRCELLHRLKECEEGIESAERIYTESAGGDNGASNFVTRWAAGRTDVLEESTKVGEGKTKEKSKGDSFASAAQILQTSAQKRNSSFLSNLNEQQNLRIKHPFSLTSATSNCHRRNSCVFSAGAGKKIDAENIEEVVLSDEVEGLKLEL